MYTRQRAHIAHRIPGRIRIVIPAQRHCAQFFAWMERQVLSANGVRNVRSRPAAASIVIHHEPGSDCLAILAAILELEVREAGVAPGVLVSLRVANARVHQLTGGRYDLAWLFARALLFMVRRHAIARIVKLIAEPLLRSLLTIQPAVEQPSQYRQPLLAA